MKALRYVAALGVLASVASAYTVIGWTEEDMPAVITGPRKDSNAQQWLVRNLESFELKDGRGVLRFKELADGAPTSGHPAAAGDFLRGKELVLSKRGEMFFLGESTTCIFIVKSVDAKSVWFAYEWEGQRETWGPIQIDRGDFMLHPDDLPKKPNQSPEPTPPAGTSAAEQPLVPAAVVAHL